MKKEYRLHIQLKNYFYDNKVIDNFSPDLIERIRTYYIKNTYYMIEEGLIQSIDIYYNSDGLFYVYISYDENILHSNDLPVPIENFYYNNRMENQRIEVADIDFYMDISLIGTY